MKKFTTLILIMSIFSCKAQNIVPIGSGDYFEKTPNYYKKDINYEFDKFVGTWKYINGNTELYFELKKEIFYQTTENSNYMDLLVGEYKYIENGIVKVNTLPDIDDTTITGYDHNISGKVFTHIIPSWCIINSENQEIKIELDIADPIDFDINGNMILRYLNDNGTEKLQVCIQNNSVLSNIENASIKIPDGFYELIKQ